MGTLRLCQAPKVATQENCGMARGLLHADYRYSCCSSVQLQDFAMLLDKYGGLGFQIIAFPCNQVSYAGAAKFSGSLQDGALTRSEAAVTGYRQCRA
jgi:hypothetical protein